MQIECQLGFLMMLTKWHMPICAKICQAEQKYMPFFWTVAEREFRKKSKAQKHINRHIKTDVGHIYVDIKTPSLHGNNSRFGAKTVNIKISWVFTNDAMMQCCAPDYRKTRSVTIPRFGFFQDSRIRVTRLDFKTLKLRVLVKRYWQYRIALAEQRVYEITTKFYGHQ